MAPRVPTGMNTGVRISPRAVRIVPRRAAPSVASTSIDSFTTWGPPRPARPSLGSRPAGGAVGLTAEQHGVAEGQEAVVPLERRRHRARASAGRRRPRSWPAATTVGRWKLVISTSTTLKRNPGVMNNRVRPDSCPSVPADSSARTVVVPTATTRRPSSWAVCTASHVSYGHRVPLGVDLMVLDPFGADRAERVQADHQVHRGDLDPAIGQAGQHRRGQVEARGGRRCRCRAAWRTPSGSAPGRRVARGCTAAAAPPRPPRAHPAAPRRAAAARGGLRRRAPRRSRSAGHRAAAGTTSPTRSLRDGRHRACHHPWSRSSPPAASITAASSGSSSSTSPAPPESRRMATRAGSTRVSFTTTRSSGRSSEGSSATVASSGATRRRPGRPAAAPRRGARSASARSPSREARSRARRCAPAQSSIIGGVGNRAAEPATRSGASEAHRATDDLLHDLGRAAVDRGDPGIGDRHVPPGTPS